MVDEPCALMVLLRALVFLHRPALANEIPAIKSKPVCVYVQCVSLIRNVEYSRVLVLRTSGKDPDSDILMISYRKSQFACRHLMNV